MELPEGATYSDSESNHDNPDDPHRALDIDLDMYVALNLSINRFWAVFYSFKTNFA